ncbi:MAG: DnaB-like helicase N-terminal domain-containing protein, partial [Oscillospiraceae bacterium]
MDELMGMRVPHSAEAEAAVIGAMLIDSACIADVLYKTRAEDFYIEINRDIFDTIYFMYAYGHTIDPITVLDQMRIRGVSHD